jgi:hypothetical protein
MDTDDFRDGATLHFTESVGGPLPRGRVQFDNGSEFFRPNVQGQVFPRCPVPQGRVRIYDHALTPDEVKREYETERIPVNKTTHRIRFENETESSVDVVIERKESSV